MDRERAKRNGMAGFSLAEALVALVIAALLATSLTRFASDTRWNAFKLRELVGMEVLSDYLLEHFTPSQLQLERTDGRSGSFRWQVDVAPIAIEARTRVLSAKETESGDKDQAMADGQAMTFGLAASTNDAARPAALGSKSAVTWIPHHVTAIITASSGRRYVTDTVKFEAREPEKRQGRGNEQ